MAPPRMSEKPSVQPKGARKGITPRETRSVSSSVVKRESRGRAKTMMISPTVMQEIALAQTPKRIPRLTRPNLPAPMFCPT